MKRKNVNANDTRDVNMEGWGKALADAERKLSEAEKELREWKTTVAICRRNVANNVSWPEESGSGQIFRKNSSSEADRSAISLNATSHA